MKIKSQRGTSRRFSEVLSEILSEEGFPLGDSRSCCPQSCCPLIQERKNSININFLVRISRGHSWPLRPDAQGSKSFSPPQGPQENALFGADVRDFRRGRPWPEGLSKNFVQKKFALIFWPLLILLQFWGVGTRPQGASRSRKHEVHGGCFAQCHAVMSLSTSLLGSSGESKWQLSYLSLSIFFLSYLSISLYFFLFLFCLYPRRGGTAGRVVCNSSTITQQTVTNMGNAWLAGLYGNYLLTQECCICIKSRWSIGLNERLIISHVIPLKSILSRRFWGHT